jgi:multidrug resistance efflux pump
MRGKWLLFSVLAVAAGIGAGALSMRARRTPPPVELRAGAAAVIATKEITLNGPIRPQHVANIGSSVDGNIETFLANVGDEVFEGQVLARVGSAGLETNREQAASAVEHAQEQVTRAESAINSARLEASRADADLQRARLQMDRTQKVFDRQKTLHNAGATPRIVYDKAVAEFEASQKEFEVMDRAARAAHEAAQTTIDQLTAAKKVLADKSSELEQAQGAFEAAEVRSPVAGTVVGRKGDVGKPAGEAGDDMFQIATDLYALEVTLEPNPEQLKKVFTGQQALVLVLDLQSAGMPGVVKDVKDGHATVEFTGTLPGIKPGMRADVRLRVE